MHPIERRAWISAIALLALYPGCLDRRVGSASDDVRGEVDASAFDTASEVDASALDGTSTPDTTPDAVPDVAGEVTSCDPLLSLARTGTLDFDQSDYAYGPVSLDGTTLYGARGGVRADGSYVLPNIVAVDLTGDVARESTLAPSDEGQAVIDARDGVLMYISTPADRQSMSLRYRDLTNGAETILYQTREPSSTRPIIGTYGPFGSLRLIERGNAVWGEQVDGSTSHAGARVRAFHRGEITTLWEGQTSIYVPTLRAGRVVWISYDPPASTVWLATLDGEVTPIGKGALEAATLSEDAAWWLDGGVLLRYDFASGQTTRANEGPCGMLVAGTTRAAAVCGPPGDNAYIARRGDPIVFEGGRSRTFATATRIGGTIRVLAGLTLSDERVAWVEYPDNVGCTGGPDERGDVVVADLAAPDRPMVVAAVGSGCWCCNAYWAPLQLGLSRSVLAWNYPRADAPVPERNGDAIGWGRFDDCR